MDRIMDEQPLDLIAYQVHLSDAYAVAWGSQRAGSYGVGGIPDSWFDGVLRRIGGSTATYSAYLNIVNTRLGVDCDTTVDLRANEVSPLTYDVTARVAIEAGGDDKDMLIHVIQVLDYYPYGFADDRYRNCLVQHAESSTISLAGGESTEFTARFALSGASASDVENVRFIAWAQTPGASGPREVFQAAHIGFPFSVDGDVDHDGDVDLADLAAMLAAYETCDGDTLYNPDADFDGDDCIGLGDLATLLANYGYGT
jgi:hypothetical protein